MYTVLYGNSFHLKEKRGKKKNYYLCLTTQDPILGILRHESDKQSK